MGEVVNKKLISMTESFQAGDYERAISIGRDVLENHEVVRLIEFSEFAVKRVLAKSYIKLGKLKDAVPYAERVVALAKNSEERTDDWMMRRVDSQILLADCYEAVDKKDAAIAELQDAQRIDACRKSVHYAEIALRLGALTHDPEVYLDAIKVLRSRNNAKTEGYARVCNEFASAKSRLGSSASAFAWHLHAACVAETLDGGRQSDLCVRIRTNLIVLESARDLCQGCAVSDKRAPHRCSGCRIARYCSEECQRKDYAVHKLLCAVKK